MGCTLASLVVPLIGYHVLRVLPSFAVVVKK